MPPSSAHGNRGSEVTSSQIASRPNITRSLFIIGFFSWAIRNGEFVSVRVGMGCVLIGVFGMRVDVIT